MSKKLYGLLLPVLAILAFASMSAAAQAAPQWVVCHKPGGKTWMFTSLATCRAGKPKVTNGEWERINISGSAHKLKVKTKGTLTLKTANGIEITCTVKDKGSIWNEGGVGKDEITEFTNTSCTSPQCTTTATITAVAASFPWLTELFEGAFAEVRDSITGAQIEANCNGTKLVFNKGTLMPEINTTTGTAMFGENSGSLETEAGLTATVAGNDEVEGESGESVSTEG